MKPETHPLPIVLIACCASKLDRPAPARELYVSDLFRKSVAWAEAKGGRWFVLSARHNVVGPNEIVAPYDDTLDQLKPYWRGIWANRCVADLLRRDLIAPGAEFVFLAGRRYRENLMPELERMGCRVHAPLEGLGIGQQKQKLAREIAQ